MEATLTERLSASFAVCWFGESVPISLPSVVGTGWQRCTGYLRRDVDELAARRIAGEEHLGDGRCLVIDGNERLPRCTLAEAGIIAVLVGGVVLRYGSQDELELRVVRERIALVVGERQLMPFVVEV